MFVTSSKSGDKVASDVVKDCPMHVRHGAVIALQVPEWTEKLFS